MIDPIDMPKLDSPFVRKEIDGAYVVTPEVAPGFEWVFEDPSVMAVEKLHGTNVSVVVEGGVVTSVWNRDARLPFFMKGKRYVMEGLLDALDRGWLDLRDGQHFGELVGPKLHGDPHAIGKHMWVPFATVGRRKLTYKSFHEHPKTFDGLSEWFRTSLFSLFACNFHGLPPREQLDKPADGGERPFCEGIVFTHPDGRMAKLRRDMFTWFKGRRHKGAA